MITFQNVTKIYRSGFKPITALSNVSFEIKPKEFVSIVGRSGAGKTTLLKILLAEEKPTQGIVLFEGQNVHQIRPEKLPYFRRELGAVFQDYKLLPCKTTFENVSYIMEVMGCTDAEIENDVPKVLEIVGLTDRADNFPEELSGGERQRAALARALIHRPQIILADEPTGNLDPYHTQEIIRLLMKVHEMGTTVILATHNKDIIDALGKRVITLEEGKIIRDEERGRFLL
ncbi:MAG: cell division ATP-binding protein FtsE [Candidatus Nealsonbacteria bacterium CG09_land_8_20_14_0_10_42_14]|uniref:Cell division ATP-binding protein FtsE n=1 Tax=Candidatus Nealsonbacteria bacterium CG09_land_8_20_14_0_10_42_14 TaxID=1974707 RepID=A0A2H0WXA5_9BACT|nr:MAG: cell division ATP-binding protein FtsE [Candidatus Nealsonbacteria bacterium CG09_land_8_20_14_0_10_42_14]